MPRHRFACPGCWFALPAPLRRAVSSNYRRHPAAHTEALAAACDFYADNQPEEDTHR